MAPANHNVASDPMDELPASGSKVRRQLQAAVESVQWTYSVFWKLKNDSRGQGLLVWSDGYYNGDIKTRKTFQAMEELTAQELCMERSVQLRELYESLSGGDDIIQPPRRPCAALSPEDLTDTEWFYLLSMSFDFAPAVGLPGRAFAEGRSLWLWKATEVDSKVFKRVLLAKSAGIQTVLCVPLTDGVLEIGVTELVREDPAVMEHVTSFFLEHCQPVCSEHSTSCPQNSHEEVVDFQPSNNSVSEIHNAGATAEDCRRYAEKICDDAMQFRSIKPIGQKVKMVTEPGKHDISESIQLEMSEAIITGSPEEGWNLHVPDNDSLESNMGLEYPDPLPYFLKDVRHGLQGCRRSSSDSTPQGNVNLEGSPLLVFGLEENKETAGTPALHDTRSPCSRTVSTTLQQPVVIYATDCTKQPLEGAFSQWTHKSNSLIQKERVARSQWMLKSILFTITRLHSKCGEQDNGSCKVELNTGHVLAERKRREKLNEKFNVLRSMIPYGTKMDKDSILGAAIQYLKQLQRRIQELEIRNIHMEADMEADTGLIPNLEVRKKSFPDHGGRKTRHQITSGGILDKDDEDREEGSISTPNIRRFGHGEQHKTPRKIRILEGSKPSQMTVVEVLVPRLEVSMLDDASLMIELKCRRRNGLLLQIMNTLTDLCLETYSIESSTAQSRCFLATIKAKGRETSCGQKPSVVQVKEAIRFIIQ